MQDSTIIKLPLRLFKVFSGVSNAYSAVCNARVQGVYDLLSGCFISFSIDPYSKNDLSAAPQLKIQKGDLVLRDRGYCTNSEIKRHIDIGADCIFRHKYNSIYIDRHTGKAIDLKSVLVNQGKLDMEVYLNDENRTKVRLIAAPVKIEVANKRRMKAKKEMRGHNPPPGLLFLMSWTIFITTIPRPQADFKKVFEIYRLRWRIEIMFKIWKSNMNFAKIHNVSENQLKVMLTARLIMIVICINLIYYPYYLKIRVQYKRYLSIMKLVNYLMINPEMLNKYLSLIKSNEKYTKSLCMPFIKYCTYDKRNRLNYCQLLEELLLS